MKNPLAILAGIVTCCISIPIIISLVFYKDIKPIVQTEHTYTLNDKSVDKSKKIVNYETVDKESPVISVYNHKLDKIQQIDIDTYLYGVLSGEMPSEFNLEALKAQAVVARTYTVYKQEHGNSSQHKNAVVCTDYKHCQEYKSYDELKKTNGEEWIKNSYSKIKQAVDKTKGQIITYDDKPILTLYFSTSSGKTENSEEVFSTKYPYLKSVESPYDKYSPKYASTLKISSKDFVSSLKKSYSDIDIDENNLKEQVKILQRSDGGSVESIKLGNKEISGRDIRSIFNLNSANFNINFSTNYLDFIVKGYGHGVGMSQWGAQGMGEEGYEYYEILSHYYSGTKIKDTY